MVQILSKLHGQKLSDSGRCESASYELLAALYNFTVTCSSYIMDSFYAHCTHQIAMPSAACNKMKVSGRQL